MRGKMTTSPCAERSTRGSPSVSRHVKGGNVTSFSPGYCPAPGPGTSATGSGPARRARACVLVGVGWCVQARRCARVLGGGGGGGEGRGEGGGGRPFPGEEEGGAGPRVLRRLHC